MIRKIVHASDFSGASRAAFTKAVEMARVNRAELTLVHVLGPVMPVAPADGYISPKAYEQLEASAHAWGRKQLEALKAKAKKAGVRAKTLLLDGVPHEAIARAARSAHADLVVLGTHGRTGVARLFLGSVAARVVATAPCPVLTVRGKGARRA